MNTKSMSITLHSHPSGDTIKTRLMDNTKMKMMTMKKKRKRKSAASWRYLAPEHNL
jgi:hypothetical protein